MGYWRLAFLIVCGTLAVAACGTLLAIDDTPAAPDAGGPGPSAVDCDGQKFDLATEPAHCGNCGRRCSSGTCNGGVCPSETVRDGLSAPRGIVADETRLAFIESGQFVDGGGGVWVGGLDNGLAKDLHVVASESGSQVAFHEGEILWHPTHRDRSVGRPSIASRPHAGRRPPSESRPPFRWPI